MLIALLVVLGVDLIGCVPGGHPGRGRRARRSGSEVETRLRALPKRLGGAPIVVELATGAATVEIAASGQHRDLLRGPYGERVD